MIRFALFGMALAAFGCNGGGSDGDDPMGSGGAGDEPATCAPLLYDKPVADMRSTVTLTIGGEAIELTFNPERSYGAEDASWIFTPIRAGCAQVRRVVQRDDGGWTQLGFWAAFEDADGALAATLSFTHGALFLQVRYQGEEYEFFDPMPLPTAAPVVPGAETVIVLDGLSGDVDLLDNRGTKLPFTLGGELRFTAPPFAVDDAFSQTVDSVYGCDPEDSRLLDVTSDKPDLLPFAGNCWDQGNTQAGGILRVDFRARPGEESVGLYSVVPWILSFDMAFEQPGPGVLQIIPPDGIVDQVDVGLSGGQARSFIEYARDGVYGHDWVAVGGTITVTELEVVSGWPVLTADFDVTYRFLGPANMDPTLDGEDIQVTGQIIVEVPTDL